MPGGNENARARINHRYLKGDVVIQFRLLFDEAIEIARIDLQDQTRFAHDLVDPLDGRDGVLGKNLRFAQHPLFRQLDRVGIIAVDDDENDEPNRGQHHDRAGSDFDRQGGGRGCRVQFMPAMKGELFPN